MTRTPLLFNLPVYFDQNNILMCHQQNNYFIFYHIWHFIHIYKQRAEKSEMLMDLTRILNTTLHQWSWHTFKITDSHLGFKDSRCLLHILHDDIQCAEFLHNITQSNVLFSFISHKIILQIVYCSLQIYTYKLREVPV